MKRFNIVALLCAVGLGASVDDSIGNDSSYHVPGGLCQAYEDDSPYGVYSAMGISSSDPVEGLLVRCPAMTNQAFGYNTVARVWVRDQASGVGSLFRFDCRLKAWTPTGGVYVSSAKYSVDGYNELAWTNPFGSGLLPALANYHLRCRLPRKQTNESYLMGFMP